MRRSFLALWESTRLAFATLIAHRFRSFLTVLGLLFGVSSVVGTVVAGSTAVVVTAVVVG